MHCVKLNDESSECFHLVVGGLSKRQAKAKKYSLQIQA